MLESDTPQLNFLHSPFFSATYLFVFQFSQRNLYCYLVMGIRMRILILVVSEMCMLSYIYTSLQMTKLGWGLGWYNIIPPQDVIKHIPASFTGTITIPPHHIEHGNYSNVQTDMSGLESFIMMLSAWGCLPTVLVGHAAGLSEQGGFTINAIREIAILPGAIIFLISVCAIPSYLFGLLCKKESEIISINGPASPTVHADVQMDITTCIVEFVGALLLMVLVIILCVTYSQMRATSIINV